ncbi:hypothetical protein Sjap_014332 [Stephania japonica]|uniref:Cytochrome P450 n=1 Tax=Stephania japonica TaxID=461633 RepID=A0AAP0J0H0_9MAGN
MGNSNLPLHSNDTAVMTLLMVMLSLLALLPITNLLWFLFHRFTLKPNTSSLSPPLPPGPVPWPIVGSIPEMIRQRKSRSLWVLSQVEKTKQGIACIRLGNIHVIAVTSPEIAREFLKTHDAVFASRPMTMANDYAGRGFLSVFTSPMGPQWKKMRRVVVSKVLNPVTLQWLLSKRLEEADSLVNEIYKQCCVHGAKLNVRNVAWQYGGNLWKRMIFNKRSFNGDDSEDGEYIEAIRTTLSLVNAFCVSDYMPCLRWLDLDGHEKIMTRAIGIINKHHDPLIDERIKSWRSIIKDEISTPKPRDLLDVLISLEDDNGKPMLSSEEIKAEATELMMAGFDNSANAAEWALAEIVSQPQILKRAVDEVDRVVGKNRLVQEKDLSQLSYVRACVREAFRLHPIATFNIPHVSISDVTVSGYFIPKGSHVLLSRLGLGRNPKVWDEPLKFRPDRHLNTGLGQPVLLTETDLRFISFSTGRRGCPAVELGTEITMMLLSRFLQGFNWSVPHGTSLVDHLKSVDSTSQSLILHAEPRLAAHVYPMTS